MPGPWTLADQGMLERLDWGNVVLAAGAPLGETGCTERLAAAGPHPAAVLDPAESAALASRIRRA